MSKDREKKYEDTEESAKGKIEQPQPEPLDKQDPTEPVKISRTKEQKGTDAGL
jgi:hypothetical protein